MYFHWAWSSKSTSFFKNYSISRSPLEKIPFIERRIKTQGLPDVVRVRASLLGRAGPSLRCAVPAHWNPARPALSGLGTSHSLHGGMLVPEPGSPGQVRPPRMCPQDVITQGSTLCTF